MNKNQRLINYLSGLILGIVVVIVLYIICFQGSNYNEDLIISAPITTTKPLPNFSIGETYEFSKEEILALLDQFNIEILGDSQSDLNDLINTPENQMHLIRSLWIPFTEIVNQQQKNETHPIRELVIAIRNNDNGVNLIFSDLSNPKGFQKGDFVIFGVNLEDILTSQNLSITKDTPLYMCDSIEPSFPVLGFESYYSDYMLKFNEGTVGCNEGLTTDSGYRNWWWLGILNNDSYKVKIYLVDENTRSQIQKSSSFAEAEGIKQLSSYL